MNKTIKPSLAFKVDEVIIGGLAPDSLLLSQIFHFGGFGLLTLSTGVKSVVTSNIQLLTALNEPPSHVDMSKCDTISETYSVADFIQKFTDSHIKIARVDKLMKWEPTEYDLKHNSIQTPAELVKGWKEVLSDRTKHRILNDMSKISQSNQRLFSWLASHKMMRPLRVVYVKGDIPITRINPKTYLFEVATVTVNHIVAIVYRRFMLTNLGFTASGLRSDYADVGRDLRRKLERPSNIAFEQQVCGFLRLMFHIPSAKDRPSLPGIASKVTLGADPEFELYEIDEKTKMPNFKDGPVHALNVVNAGTNQPIGTDACSAIAEIRPNPADDATKLTMNIRQLMKQLSAKIEEHAEVDFIAPVAGGGFGYSTGGHIHFGHPLLKNMGYGKGSDLLGEMLDDFLYYPIRKNMPGAMRQWSNIPGILKNSRSRDGGSPTPNDEIIRKIKEAKGLTMDDDEDSGYDKPHAFRNQGAYGLEYRSLPCFICDFTFTRLVLKIAHGIATKFVNMLNSVDSFSYADPPGKKDYLNFITEKEYRVWESYMSGHRNDRLIKPVFANWGIKSQELDCLSFRWDKSHDHFSSWFNQNIKAHYAKELREIGRAIYDESGRRTHLYFLTGRPNPLQNKMRAFCKILLPEYSAVVFPQKDIKHFDEYIGYFAELADLKALSDFYRPITNKKNVVCFSNYFISALDDSVAYVAGLDKLDIRYKSLAEAALTREYLWSLKTAIFGWGLAWLSKDKFQEFMPKIESLFKMKTMPVPVERYQVYSLRTMKRNPSGSLPMSSVDYNEKERAFWEEILTQRAKKIGYTQAQLEAAYKRAYKGAERSENVAEMRPEEIENFSDCLTVSRDQRYCDNIDEEMWGESTTIRTQCPTSFCHDTDR